MAKPPFMAKGKSDNDADDQPRTAPKGKMPAGVIPARKALPAKKAGKGKK